MNVRWTLLVMLFAVTWANETSQGGHGLGQVGRNHHCVDYFGCCSYIHYPFYFRQCCYLNGCCPSCHQRTTQLPHTVKPTTPTPPPLTPTPQPAHCEDKQGCCHLMNRPVPYIQCVKENGCAPFCGGLGFVIRPTCDEGRECCRFPFLSSEFNKCCTYYGCCPPCKTSDKKCVARSKCTDAGGVCKKRCEDDEEVFKQRKYCKGRKCKCCVTKTIVITPDCVNATECCTYEAGTGDFYECCAKYNCCPTCAASGCLFGNKTYNDGEIVQSHPEKCFDLRCSLTTTLEAPYYISKITVYQHSNSCSCCMLGGKMYEDGYLLTDDNHCIAIQCVEGEWVNQGYINANCRICQVQQPLVTFKTFDGTTYTYGEGDCRYSMVQTPKDPSTSYIHAEFVPVYLGHFIGQLYFQDEGAPEVSCPGSDPFNHCDYGPITETPKKITSIGTLGFTWSFGTLPFSTIMGANKITSMYTNSTLLIMAPVSMYNELGGLCGEYNDDDSDDLTMSTGQITIDANIFAQSWHSSQSGPNCSLLGPDVGSHHAEVFSASVQPQLVMDHSKHKTNTLAVGNCAHIENEDHLVAYHSACQAYLKTLKSTTHRNLWAQQRNGNFKDGQMDLCMQVSCLCPENQDECLNGFKSMSKLLEELEMRTLDPPKMHRLLERRTCKQQQVTGTFQPEITQGMNYTTHDDSD